MDLRPASPEVIEYRDFSNTDAQARSSLCPETPPATCDPRNITTSDGLLAELERRKKPGDNDLPERAESLLTIMSVIL